ncbi:MAG: glycosyltransferase family 4 protein [Bryobacteraceae bacterium]
MRIVLVHNKYRQPGGEDVVFEQEKRMLEDAGHNVATYCRSNDELNGFSSWERAILPIRIVWATNSKLEFEQLLAREKPDLVHIHNTFMMVSPSIYSSCRERVIPVVQTLHNYRLLCPEANFFRDGGVCEECVDHGLLRSVRHGCYHGSRTATAAVALMIATHRKLGTWETMVSRYIALSEFSRKKFVSGGIPAEKITVKPNFVDPDPGTRQNIGNFAVFMGRVSREKGALTLLDAWEQIGSRCALQIIGEGSSKDLVQNAAKERNLPITMCGHLSRDEAIAAVKTARFLVLPSLCYENFPMSIVEAFACGTPVLCSRLGGMKELVEDQRTGLHFTPGDAMDLAEKVQWALDHPLELAAMGGEARREFETQYTAKSNYSRLMDIYEQAIAANAASSTCASAGR